MTAVDIVGYLAAAIGLLVLLELLIEDRDLGPLTWLGRPWRRLLRRRTVKQIRQSSTGSFVYNQRLADIADFVARKGAHVYASDIRMQLGGKPQEITAKLQELRKRGIVEYDGIYWSWRSRRRPEPVDAFDDIDLDDDDRSGASARGNGTSAR